MNCLPLVTGHVWNHAWNHVELQGSCFMWTASGCHVHVHYQKIKKIAIVQNYVILINVYNLQLVNKVKMERIIVLMGNCEFAFWKKGIFFGGELQSSMRSSHVHVSGIFGFRCWVMKKIITLIPVFAECLELRWNKVFCSRNSWISILKEN